MEEPEPEPEAEAEGVPEADEELVAVTKVSEMDRGSGRGGEDHTRRFVGVLADVVVGSHGGVGIIVADLVDLGDDLGFVRAADAWQVGWVRLSAFDVSVSSVSGRV